MAIITSDPDINVALDKINNFGSYEDNNYIRYIINV